MQNQGTQHRGKLRSFWPSSEFGRTKPLFKGYLGHSAYFLPK
jgi:hypothetical protein